MFARLAFLHILMSILHASAQNIPRQNNPSNSTIPPFTFFFGFGNLSGNVLAQCDTLSMFVTSTTGGDPGPVSTPPYTLISYSPDNARVETVVGSNPRALSWQVKHPANSQVLLSMVDSAGNQGGVAPLYSVRAGSSNSCLPPSPQVNFDVITNATQIGTCDALRIVLNGGTKPYKLALVIGQQNLTNVVLGPDDNEYTWINRAPPNVDLIVSAVDSKNQNAISSNLISTRGPSDATCGGRQSSSGSTSSVGPSPSPGSTAHVPSSSAAGAPSSAAPPPKSSGNSGAIAGGLIGGILLLMVLVAVFFFLRRRKARTVNRGHIDLDGAAVGRKSSVRGANIEPYCYVPSHTPQSETPHTPSQYAQSQCRQSQYAPSELSPGYGYTPSQADHPSYPPYGYTQDNKNRYSTKQSELTPNPFASQTHLGDPFQTPTPSVVNFAVGDVQHSGDLSDRTHVVRQTRLGVANPGMADEGVASAPPSTPGWSEKRQRLQELQDRDNEPQTVIVRHQDAGVAILDLPPAYGEQIPPQGSRGTPGHRS